MDYKSSGVDIEEGRKFVERIKAAGASIGAGGFNGLSKIPGMTVPHFLVSGCDGVGTKIRVAQTFGDYTTIGIDLVAMCVNDVICSGATPLYFLDYISIGKIDQDILGQIMQGILKGCEISDMPLIGGETAEHGKPLGGSKLDLDLAGFCTGMVSERELVDGKLIKPGDKIIGIESSGLHSNGYSLINDMLWRHKIYYKETPELLTPTTIYAPIVKKLMETETILGMAHITGGGIPENLPRCLPEGLTANVDYNSWRIPDIFTKIMCAGEILEDEMKKVFNLGIGLCVVVPSEEEENVKMIIAPYHECWTIGEIVVQ